MQVDKLKSFSIYVSLPIKKGEATKTKLTVKKLVFIPLEVLKNDLGFIKELCSEAGAMKLLEKANEKLIDNYLKDSGLREAALLIIRNSLAYKDSIAYIQKLYKAMELRITKLESLPVSKSRHMYKMKGWNTTKRNVWC